MLSGDDGEEITTFLKHLILFLNYCQSRLDNPVYRLFSSERKYRRDVTMLFLLKPLEERELQHEVAQLRKNQEAKDDITFHICANFGRPDEGAQIVQTIRLIRRQFPSGIDFHFPTFVYGQMPELKTADEELRKTVWRNLVMINNAVSDFIECRLLSTVYLYNDPTQNSLAELIFTIAQSGISFDKLSARLPVKEQDLFGMQPGDEDCAPGEDGEMPGKEGETPENRQTDFPPIFGSFNTVGIRYPEEEIRAHIHSFYLHSALRYALADVNETKVEVCNENARRILSFVPIATRRICLQEDGFINLNPNSEQKWQAADKFWEENVELQMQGLSDVPRADWLIKIRQRVDALYQGRFRDIGTDYFFKLENGKSAEYCNILRQIIEQEYNKTIQSNPYSLDAQKTIVRGIINILQQKVMEIEKLKADTLSNIDKIELELKEIKDRWNSLGIFSRLRGKDGEVLGAYRAAITRLMVECTLVPGCDFATKLLNELIPEVSALIERCDDFGRIITDALHTTENIVRDTDPSELFGIFGNKELSQARLAIEADRENLLKEYRNAVNALFDIVPVTDGDDLLSRIRATSNENADVYLEHRMEDCSVPQILGMSIIERIERITSTLGGFPVFVENLKRKAPIRVEIKKTCQTGSRFILTAPASADQNIEGVEFLKTEDLSQLQLLNIRFGLTLQDLDGFSGQRMFVEPSIF